MARRIRRALSDRIPEERGQFPVLVILGPRQVDKTTLALDLTRQATKPVTRHLDLLTDLFLVRQLARWFRNIGKWLIKAPRVFVRDPGLVHDLANIHTLDTLLNHPLCGPSWEGSVIENLPAAPPA